MPSPIPRQTEPGIRRDDGKGGAHRFFHGKARPQGQGGDDQEPAPGAEQSRERPDPESQPPERGSGRSRLAGIGMRRGPQGEHGRADHDDTESFHEQAVPGKGQAAESESSGNPVQDGPGQQDSDKGRQGEREGDGNDHPSSPMRQQGPEEAGDSYDEQGVGSSYRGGQMETVDQDGHRQQSAARSEERRVGKECSSRGKEYHQQK